MEEYALSAFVLQHDNVVCLLADIVDGHIRAPLTESLDDLRRLRTSTPGSRAAVAPIRAASPAAHLPRLAVGDIHASLVRRHLYHLPLFFAVNRANEKNRGHHGYENNILLIHS